MGGALLPGRQAVGHEQAEGQAHLVVAAAAGVQLFAHVADDLGEAGLDVHVHVFQRRFPDKGAGFDLLLHGIETVDDLFGLVGRDDALTAQHAGMGLGTADVLGIEGAVIGLGIGIGGHGFSGAFGEAAAPALIGAHGKISLPREGPVYALRRAMTGGRKRRRPVRDADGAAFRMEKNGADGSPRPP